MTPAEIRKLAEGDPVDRWGHKAVEALRALADVVEAANKSGPLSYALKVALARVEALKP